MELCVALDLPTKEENLKLLKILRNYDIWIKLGLRAYLRDGNAFITEIKNINPSFRIFLDLKLYDIPNTMADSIEFLSTLDIDMLNMHISAGEEAIIKVKDRLKNLEKTPLLIGVTALTSFDDESFKKIYTDSINKKVEYFTKLSYECSLNGVVCSAFESKSIKKKYSKDFLTICPGIRPFGINIDDQKRVANIKEAKENLVDIIVVGRPIYQSFNKEETLAKIMEALE